MKKTLVLAIIAIFIGTSVWAGKTIMNAPGGKRTSAQLTNTMAFPLDSGTGDYWTDLAEHYTWVKAQMDVLYASKPWYDGAANSGSLLKLYGPTVANGGHGTWTALQGADYVGDEGTGMTWRLPIAAYPSAGTTALLNVDEYGQMGLLASTTYAAASHNQAYTTITGVTGNSKYLGTDSGGTYGIFDLPSGGSMTWPSAGGIPLYTGSSSWGTSLSSSTAYHYLRRNATNDGYEFGALPAYPTQSSLSVDDLITLSGVADGSVHLGEFTGTTITDNQTVKAALQLLETAIEGIEVGWLADIDVLPGDTVDDDKIDAELIASLTATYAVIAGTPSTSFQLDNDASGPLLKWDSGNTQVTLRNSGDSAYYDLRIKNLYAENINSTKDNGAYLANFDNTVAITFTPAQGDLWSETGILKFRDATATRNILNDNSSLDDDKVAFDDADNLWTATTIGAALEELNDSINAEAPNGTGAKVHWSQLLGVPAGFADGADAGTGDFMADGSVVATGNFVFEGSTADDYETTFAITDPTADRTVTFPNASGTIAYTADIPSAAAASDINTGTDTTKFLTADALAGSNLGIKEIGWTIKDSDVVTAVADGKQAFVVPAAWNGMNLVDLTCAVADLNSAASGDTTVVLRRVRGTTAADMTSTGVTIAYNEYSASDETVDTSNDDIQTGDKIYVDVNAITTAAHKGLSCTASFQLP